jgi:diguanylate cyclase (GGDEF)-like protein
VIAQKIRGAIAEPITTAELHASITASIGVTVARPGEGMDALMARADIAMYKAKQAGRNQVILIE